jgi:serine/threonine-protein kinase
VEGQPQQEALLIPELPSGTIYGKHEILQRLAIGGMAEIYLARVRGTAGFEKLVVLKRILPHFAIDPRFVQMFLGEARLAAALQHPNIADVYDVGQEGGSYYFTMEFVHGQDLRTIRGAVRKLRQGVPLQITLAIIHGALSALDYAHSKTGPDGRPLGLVHRDVSTSNVMISYDGAVKLLDFGIARASTQSSAYRTETGTLKGKIPYMSPEQCKGAPVDARSDLWSLGVVLYELTVGQRPFRGESDFAIMDQIVNKGARSPGEVLPGYPADLEAIVMKALARDVNARYANAEEMLHDLEQAISTRGPWVSPKHLGKYMRQLFTDRIAAWENAQLAGLTLAQHVIEPITSPSHGHVTPSSQAGLATPRPSQVTAAAAPEIVGIPPSFVARPTPTSIPVAPPMATGPNPALRPATANTLPDNPHTMTFPTSTQVAPRSRGALRVLVIGGVAAILVAAVAIVAMGGGKSTSESAPSETIQLRENAPPAASAPPASAPAPAAASAPPASAPPPAAPAAAPSASETTSAAPPAKAPSAPTASSEPSVKAEKPALPSKKQPTAKTVTKPPVKGKAQKQPDGKTSKEEKWSQDSFSLPQ